MAATTPRRSTRIPHTHTPKMSERKKGLFQREELPSRESLTTHRKLPVVDSESDSEDCDLGIISTLDSSSDENDQNVPKTPERSLWHETRSQTRKLLKESNDLKNFIKSPFTLKKYQTRYCPESKCSGSVSTPATPHLNNHPGTPSSTHSCASVHTTSSTSSRARKSLASLIADTESCSSSLKDLNFDTDSGTDSKENTPTKSLRRSNRRNKLTPKFHSFKGILLEQKKNVSPMKNAVVCLTKMDMNSIISPTQMQKTPQTTDAGPSPPKLGHNRRSVIEIGESPESACDSEKSNKRLRNDSLSEHGPNSKYPRLENAPKARLSLFNSDRLKEILSAKSFYGKSNPDLNTNLTAKISHAIEATTSNRRLRHSHSHRRKRKPGQINSGVRHRIRKPKYNKSKVMKYQNASLNSSMLNDTVISNPNVTDASMVSQNSSQELCNDKADPFDKEKQTIEALLSQWTEEDIPESELSYSKPMQELPCFNSTVIEETKQIFQPITAVPVNMATLPQDNEAVIVELGCQKAITPQNNCLPSTVEPLPQVALPPTVAPLTTLSRVTVPSIDLTLPPSATNDVVMTEVDGHAQSHGELPKSGQFLPVEGGYILVEENAVQAQEVLPDLDEIERELKMLDEQILKMAESNNINPDAVLASTETIPAVGKDVPTTSTETSDKSDKPKLFPIFDKPNPGIVVTGNSKGGDKSKRLIKTGDDQYVIDAGQKKFGATQCTECGTIYQIGDPQDEHDHLVHHNATDVLKFNGFKDECIVDRPSPTERCIRIRGGENGWKKVEQLLNRVVHPHLGYGNELPKDQIHAFTAYLYVDKKQIVGCLIVEPKLRAYKLIPGDPDCCSVEGYSVKCGVSRIWTHINHRRRGIAARLLSCARASFLYGEALKVTDIAFSAPTAAGKAFATKYCGTSNFYVYLE